MTAMNLALHNKYGCVIWGDSLNVEKKLVYWTAFDGRGVVREIAVDTCPFSTMKSENSMLPRNFYATCEEVFVQAAVSSGQV